MRVALDVSYIQKKRAGIGRYTIGLLDAILDADSDNEYLLFGWSFSLESQKITSYARPNVHFRIARIPGALRRYYWTRLTHPRLSSLVGRFDVFHSADPLLPPLDEEPALITVYDLASRHFPGMFEKYVLSLEKYVHRTIHRADAIIVPSEFTKTDLLKAGDVDEGKIHVIPPPVGAPKPGSAESDREVLRRHSLEAPFILTVGTIEPRKNHLNLIRAFEQAGRREKDFHLVIAGKLGWHYSEALEAMRSSPLGDRIHYLEYVSEGDLEVLYRSARCVVYPSFFEGGGLPVLEAMAAGTPVVTSDSSAMKEVGEGASLLVNPSDPDDIAAGFLKVLRDSALARDLVRKGRERAGKFSASASAQKLLALYRSLV
jgi:glycosyltransferase involved in cell wall biosynthesis